MNWVKKRHSRYRDMSSKQLEVLFSNKHSLKIVYLDSLLKKYKERNRVSKILDMEEMLLEISRLKTNATKDKLVF